MKTLSHLAFAALLAMVFGPMTTAQAKGPNLDFELVNSTGYPIKEIYIGPSSSPEWGENIMTSVLNDGETLEVSFSPSETATKWDLKIVWTDGSDDVVWKGYDLSEISKLTLFYDAETDVTTATSE